MKLRSLFVPAILVLTGIMMHTTTSAASNNVPVFDIPKIENVTIDGNPGDWGNRGFQVNALAPEHGALYTPDESVTFRLGWNDDGLLVLLKYSKANIVEDDNIESLWQKDSVEFYLAKALGSKDRYQWIIAGGITSAHPDYRLKVYDLRESPTLQSIPLDAKVARTRTSEGYIIEACMPWKNLGVTAKPGTEAAFQVLCNMVNGGDKIRPVWYPEAGGQFDTHKLNIIRLSNKSSASVDCAASYSTIRFRKLKLNVYASPSQAGVPVMIKNGKSMLAKGILSRIGNKSVYTYIGQMAPGGIPSANKELTADGQALTVETENLKPQSVVLDGLKNERVRTFNEARFDFGRYIIDNNNLPSGDFVDASMIEDAIGEYTVKTTYYDAGYNIVTTADKPGRYGAVTTITSTSGLKRTIRNTFFRTTGPISYTDFDELKAAVTFPGSFGIVPSQYAGRDTFISQSVGEMLLTGTAIDDTEACLCAALYEAKPGDRPRLVATRELQWWSGLNEKLGIPPYPHLVYTPKGYETNASIKWPVFIFLHGSGERGSNIEDLRAYLKDKTFDEHATDRFIYVAPQCPEGEGWNPWDVKRVIDDVCTKYRVDMDRIYLGGLSMGGYGTYATAMQFPEMFAALAPAAGAGDIYDTAQIKNIPVWAFHGDKDSAVRYEDDVKLLDALTANGGRIKFTTYVNGGHDISWTKVYQRPDLYDWLLQQKRGIAAQAVGLEKETIR